LCGLCAITPTCPPALSLRARAPPTTTTSTTPSTLPGLPCAHGVDGVGAGGNDLVRSSPVRRPQPRRPQSCSTPTIVSASATACINVVQPYQHHENVPPGWHQRLLFALKPEDQPSGSCNMSRIDNATPSCSSRDGHRFQVSVYATNYNVLRIMSEWVGSLTSWIAYGYQW
jgi:hypothetical protein